MIQLRVKTFSVFGLVVKGPGTMSLRYGLQTEAKGKEQVGPPAFEGVVGLTENRSGGNVGIEGKTCRFSPGCIPRIKLAPFEDLLQIIGRWVPEREGGKILDLIGYQPAIKIGCSEKDPA